MKVITDKREYYLVMSEIESYLQKGFDALSPEDEERLHDLSTAAEAWEFSAYPMPTNPQIRDILLFVMHQRKINQTELSQALDISKTLLSDVINGKKKPNLEIVKNLHKQFNVDGNIILESLL
jgi:antitoxin component HigA of HigAB toxin-antitoxin module